MQSGSKASILKRNLILHFLQLTKGFSEGTYLSLFEVHSRIPKGLFVDHLQQSLSSDAFLQSHKGPFGVQTLLEFLYAGIHGLSHT
jgi:hypothetical protein